MVDQSETLIEASRVVALVDAPERMAWWARLDNGLDLEITYNQVCNIRQSIVDHGRRVVPMNGCCAVSFYLGLQA